MDFSPYAGRWIALTESHTLAGIGTTREEASAAAHATHPKERLRLMWITPQPPYLALPAWPLSHLKPLLPAEGVWLVGGPVRDLLLGREIHDWDFAVAQGGRKLARTIADALHAAYYPLDDERDTGRVIATDPHTHRPIILDFAVLRGATLEEDLWRRDFTINALALTPEGVLIDPTGGQADLDAGLIRITGPSSFKDDPVRLLRAVRLANRLRFHIEPHTEQAIRTQAATIHTATPERICAELLQMVHDVPAARNLQALADLGLLRHVLPEIWALRAVQQSSPHHYADACTHTLATLAAVEGILALLKGEARPPSTDDAVNVPPWTWPLLAETLLPFQAELLSYLETPVNADMPRADLLKWGALFHDVGKAATRSVDANGYTHFYDHPQVGAELAAARLEALRFPKKAADFVVMLVTEHMRLIGSEKSELSRRAIYRFYRVTGDAGVSVVLLSLGDVLAVWERELTRHRWRNLLHNAGLLLNACFAQPTQIVAPPPLLNGYDVIALGVPQGPQVGQILETLREAQAAGEVATREEAVALVKSLAAEHTE